MVAAVASVACWLLYFLWYRDTYDHHHPHRRSATHHFPLTEGLENTASTPEEESAAAKKNLDEQAAIDFSDVMLDPAERSDAQTAEANRRQIEGINERFEGAKRRALTNQDRGLRVNHTNPKDRWRLVQTLLRRPPCGRRVRSWRTENSDTLRGDVVPNNPSSWGMMRSARSNPQADLHPGALGQLSGSGRWNSTELLPENVIVD